MYWMSSLWAVSGGRCRQSLSVLVRAYKRTGRGLTIGTVEGVRVFPAHEEIRQHGCL